MNSVKENFDSNIVAAGTIMSELLATISLDMQTLGLEQDQENFICEKIEGSSDKLHHCLQESTSIEETLNSVVELLERLTLEQNKIIAENLAASEIVEDNSNDIELF